MIEKCKHHLDDVHEDYLTHLFFAVKIAALCFIAGIALIIHALIPAFFERTGSTVLQKIHDMIAARKHKLETETAA